MSAQNDIPAIAEDRTVAAGRVKPALRNDAVLPLFSERTTEGGSGLDAVVSRDSYALPMAGRPVWTLFHHGGVDGTGHGR